MVLNKEKELIVKKQLVIIMKQKFIMVVDTNVKEEPNKFKGCSKRHMENMLSAVFNYK
jgi:hypothetical protein